MLYPSLLDLQDCHQRYVLRTANPCDEVGALGDYQVFVFEWPVCCLNVLKPSESTKLICLQ